MSRALMPKPKTLGQSQPKKNSMRPATSDNPIDLTIIPASPSPPPYTHRRPHVQEVRPAKRPRVDALVKESRSQVSSRAGRSDRRHDGSSVAYHPIGPAPAPIATSTRDRDRVLEKHVNAQTEKIDRLQQTLDEMGKRVTAEILAIRQANDSKIKDLSTSLKGILTEISVTVNDIRSEKAFRAGATGGQKTLWNGEWGNILGYHNNDVMAWRNLEQVNGAELVVWTREGQGGGIGPGQAIIPGGAGHEHAAASIHSGDSSGTDHTFWTADGASAAWPTDSLKQTDIAGMISLEPQTVLDMPVDQALLIGPLDPELERQLVLAATDFEDAFPDDISLNSGIETLPTNCTRESTVMTEYASEERSKVSSRATTPGRALRERSARSMPYGGHAIEQSSRQEGRQARGEVTRDPSPRERSRSIDTQGTTSSRQIRGRSALPPVVLQLLPSEGPKRGEGAKWPAHGKNTMSGRLQEITCDECQGRAHWACAGLSDGDHMLNEPWSCPGCVRVRRQEGDQSPSIIEPVQQHRCIRPDCIVRSSKKLIGKNDDGDIFGIEGIVGRRRVSRNGNSKPVYEYLVKWTGWSIQDCTWEPPRNIPDLGHWEDHFRAEAHKAGVEMIWRVAMLPVTERYWDSRGHLKVDVLEEEGIELKEWMIDHRLNK